MNFEYKLNHTLFENTQDELRPRSSRSVPKLADLLRSDIPFVVAGARAVNVYTKNPRNTLDIDILTDQYDKMAQWIQHEYPHLQMKSSDVVIRFSLEGEPVLDIMIPGDKVFKSAMDDTKKVGKYLVVAPEALIALKFHGIMSNNRKLPRKAQDRVDIGNILDNNKIDLRKVVYHIRHLFPGASHALIGIIKKIKEDFGID